MSWCEQTGGEPLRILCKGDLGKVQDLDRGDRRENDGQERSDMNDRTNVEQGDDDDNDLADEDEDDVSYTTEQLVHRYIQPEPTVKADLGHLTTDHSIQRSFKSLQVIVKLANIHLTPEKPTYDGGAWHIEGQMVSDYSPEGLQIFTVTQNEHIVATSLFYVSKGPLTLLEPA